jgi:hypothetical protein
MLGDIAGRKSCLLFASRIFQRPAAGSILGLKRLATNLNLVLRAIAAYALLGSQPVNLRGID